MAWDTCCVMTSGELLWALHCLTVQGPRADEINLRAVPGALSRLSSHLHPSMQESCALDAFWLWWLCQLAADSNLKGYQISYIQVGKRQAAMLHLEGQVSAAEPGGV